MDALIWIGIGFCITQSAMFSGLNLALFSVSRLRLEVEASRKNPHAVKTLALRKDSNLLLTTVLWGNVGINVLLTLLSDSVLAGVSAFLFSTVVITLLGEIMPQAYFSRHALRMASLFEPALKFYRIILYPVAKPPAMLLDRWLGPEGIHYFRERDLRELIKKHMEASETDIDHVEGKGALNFLAMDDMLVAEEGEPLDPKSVVILPFVKDMPVFPKFQGSPSDPFLQQVEASGKKWVIISNAAGKPKLVLDSDGFLRAAFFHQGKVNPYIYCHRPIIISDTTSPLGEVIMHLKVKPDRPGDDVIDKDIILVWGATNRVITGADILGLLLRGITGREGEKSQMSAHPKTLKNKRLRPAEPRNRPARRTPE